LKRLTVISAAAWLAGCAVQSTEFDETWFVCNADRACALVADPASCALIPVNLRHADAFEQRLALAHIGEHAKNCSVRARDYRPVCLDERCSSQPATSDRPTLH
jgi:hypothetical protein